MIYGYARVSADGQSVKAQVAQLTAAGGAKVFQETASGAKTDRRALARAIKALEGGDTLLVTRLDRLARSTRDLLNTLAQITEREAGFKSLADAWADTTTAHGRLMLTVLGGLAKFERKLTRVRRMGSHPSYRAHGLEERCANAENRATRTVQKIQPRWLERMLVHSDDGRAGRQCDVCRKIVANGA